MLRLLATSLMTLGIVALFTGCLTEDECQSTTRFVEFRPVWLTLEQMRQDIGLQAARTIEDPGKIYFYQDYVLINERGKGIHIIDNANPKSPVIKAFYNIPGNFDMAIRNDVLYADNYADLLTIDFSNPTAPSLVGSTPRIFNVYQFDNSRGAYLAFYERTNRTQTQPCNSPAGQRGWFWGGGGGIWVDAVRGGAERVFNSSTGTPSVKTGTGGSMARFTAVGDYLYAVDRTALHAINLENAQNPKVSATNQLGWNIETIYPYNENLFVGSASGMFIMGLKDPARPSLLSTFNHARACDPVVVEGTTAYVTLRDGTTCEGFANQLDVVDVSNLLSPKLLKTYPMDNPHGLAIDKSTLYLCEGKHGFKIFDAVDNLAIKQKNHLKGWHAYDVIKLSDGILMVIGSDGFYQFDATDPLNPKQISVIPVKPATP